MKVILKDKKIVVAEALLESVIKDCNIKDYKEIKKLREVILKTQFVVILF